MIAVMHLGLPLPLGRQSKVVVSVRDISAMLKFVAVKTVASLFEALAQM